MDEQRRRVKELMSTTQLTVGQNAYLVSLKWFSEFKRIIGYDNESPVEQEIPKIDNSALMRNDRLRRDIVEGVDYIIVTKPTWHQLKQYYGGGPDIGVHVAYNPLKKQNVAITKNIGIYVLYKGQLKLFPVTTYENVKYLKDEALKCFETTDKSLDLYEYYNNTIGEKLLDDKLLCEYSVTNNQKLMLSTGAVQKSEESGLFSFFQSNVSCTPGTTGLNNIGNTCFLNSTLQCLMHIEPLIKYFLKTQWQMEISQSNPLSNNGELATAFFKLLQISQSGKSLTYTPSDMRKAIIRHAPNFDGYAQQDAHEVLLYILDGIHEDLNRILNKPTTGAVEGDGTNDAETAVKAWSVYKQRNDSIIVDLFQGQLKSHLKCPNCHSDTVVFDPFVSLSLPVPQKKVLSPGFIFVPADPKKPRKLMQFNIDNTWSPLMTKRFIQKSEGGRQLNLIFAAIDHQFTEVTYSLAPYRTPSTHYMYALEIPSTDKLYAPVFLKEREKGWIWDGDKPIAGPFLVPIPKSSPSEKELNDAISDYFSYLFDPENPDIQINYDQNEQTRLSWRPLKDNKKKFEIVIRSGLFESGTFAPCLRMTCLTRRCVDVIVNPTWMTKEAGFKYSLFVPPRIKDVEPPEEEKSFSVERCLDMFAEELTLDDQNEWYCPKCKKFVQASKKMDVWKAPQILIIHLKRFAQSGGYFTKTETEIQYPDVLDMSRWIVGPQSGSTSYKLVAVSEHHGWIGSGHYTAHALVGDQWYFFNDSTVTKCTGNEAHSRNAYILFYARIDS